MPIGQFTTLEWRDIITWIKNGIYNKATNFIGGLLVTGSRGSVTYPAGIYIERYGVDSNYIWADDGNNGLEELFLEGNPLVVSSKTTVIFRLDTGSAMLYLKNAGTGTNVAGYGGLFVDSSGNLKYTSPNGTTTTIVSGP